MCAVLLLAAEAVWDAATGALRDLGERRPGRQEEITTAEWD